MKSPIRYFATVLMTLFVVATGCSTENEHAESEASEVATSERSEHERDSGEGMEEGEESGTEYARNETYNNVRNGALLILAYDPDSNSFIGAMQNTTNATLNQVRVEVHLSNGTELGPTTPVDLRAGAMVEVVLPATAEAFERWTAHPEVGSGEGGEHGEDADEHDGEGSEEHGEEGEEEHS